MYRATANLEGFHAKLSEPTNQYRIYWGGLVGVIILGSNNFQTCITQRCAERLSTEDHYPTVTVPKEGGNGTARRSQHVLVGKIKPSVAQGLRIVLGRTRGAVGEHHIGDSSQLQQGKQLKSAWQCLEAVV
ncbi:hypothetical protein FQZ97_1123190 [compost metagenome]